MSNKNVLFYVIAGILGVAIVLCAVLVPLYAVGIIGNTLQPSPDRKEKEADPFENFTFKSVSATSMPKGQYADFTITYNGKDYSVKIYLLSDYAPETVDNFVKYAKDGLYDGTVFYRSDISFYEDTGKPSSAYLQGGAYTVNNAGELVRKTPNPYYGKIKGEFLVNDPETKNNISFTAGTIGMVREEGYDSADTEFFFMSYAHPEFDGYYAAFGIVVESDASETLYTFTKALYEADGDYPVTIKKVNVYTRE